MSQAAILAAIICSAATLAAPAAAQRLTADIALANGGSQRVLVAGPANGRDPDYAARRRRRRRYRQRRRQWAPVGQFSGAHPAALAGSGLRGRDPRCANGASLLGRRHTAAYADAIGRAVDFARGRANAPVWLVGTSQGSIAAANGAAHLPGRVAGVVLTSSVTRAGNSGETLFDSEPAAIAVPTLVVANQGDACPVSPPADATAIAAAVARAPRKEVILVQSGDARSAPCEAMSPHGFLGIEPVVVQRIADWIRATPRR